MTWYNSWLWRHYSPLLRLGEEVPVGGAEKAECDGEEQELAVDKLIEWSSPHEQESRESSGSGGGHLVLVADRHVATAAPRPLCFGILTALATSPIWLTAKSYPSWTLRKPHGSRYHLFAKNKTAITDPMPLPTRIWHTTTTIRLTNLLCLLSAYLLNCWRTYRPVSALRLHTR